MIKYPQCKNGLYAPSDWPDTCKTLPLPRASAAFVAMTLPLACASAAFVVMTLPLPCASAAFVAMTLPCASAACEVPYSCNPYGEPLLQL